jgi:uncharacterized protein (TIGR00369 family)
VDLDKLRDFFEKGIPFNAFLGMRIGELREGFLRLELPWRDEFTGDPWRPAMHGGVISTLADTAGGMVVWSALNDVDARVSTVDLRVDYLRPGDSEDLAVDAKVLRVGNRVGVADMRVYHPVQAERTIATAKGVYAIRPSKVADDEPDDALSGARG